MLPAAMLFASLMLAPAPVGRDSAQVIDGRLVIQPLGVSLTLPSLWLAERQATPSVIGHCSLNPAGSVADRVVIERDRLHVLQLARGDWRREYSSTMNAVLPFAAVVAQVGGDPWVLGQCSALQMRVYVGEPGLIPGEAEVGRGVAVARTYFSPVERSQYEKDGWAVAHLSWSAHYWDYGGTANIEFWSRLVYGRALVLVFTYEDESGRPTVDRRSIVDSFRLVER